MYHLIYASSVAKALTQRQLGDLLTKSRQNNIKLDITGMLIYTSGHFIQVLEGEEDVVKKLYNSIRKDTRHKDVIVIYEGELAERQFANREMDFRVLHNEPVFTDAELENDTIGTLKMLNDYIEYLY